jgi:hypothetical protein
MQTMLHTAVDKHLAMFRRVCATISPALASSVRTVRSAPAATPMGKQKSKVTNRQLSTRRMNATVNTGSKSSGRDLNPEDMNKQGYNRKYWT